MIEEWIARMRAALPAVEPMPPHVTGPIPWLGAAFGLLRDPTRYLTRLCARLGDTFVLDGLGYRLFFVFSPAGVRALYAAPEEQASFGLATFELVLNRKIPFELAATRVRLCGCDRRFGASRTCCARPRCRRPRS